MFHGEHAEIDEIWDDVLQIKPCNMENGSLSYKFPLLSGEFDCETVDISESSIGESQVINWEFFWSSWNTWASTNIRLSGSEGIITLSSSSLQNFDSLDIISPLYYEEEFSIENKCNT